MRVIIRGSWAPYVGTDYCDALGIYDSLDEAWPDAEQYAWDRWEYEPDEEDGIADEGPDYYIEEYTPDHDNHRAGGGSFAPEFEAMEKRA